MIPLVKKMIGLALAVALTAMSGSTSDDKDNKGAVNTPDKSDMPRVWISNEPNYQGKILSYWLKVLRDRDEELMPVAFDAIRYLSPDASAAVPELTRIVAAPFAPIQVGKDSEKLIADKLYDIEIRAEAIDVLASIGKMASSATLPLIQWALTTRVIPAAMSDRDDHELFVDLVTMDVEKRIGVIRAVVEFGEGAVPSLARLLTSNDPEKRKLAVTILGEDVLPVAADLLKSRNCDDQELGITILSDMEPAVAKASLRELRGMFVCEAN